MTRPMPPSSWDASLDLRRSHAEWMKTFHQPQADCKDGGQAENDRRTLEQSHDFFLFVPENVAKNDAKLTISPALNFLFLVPGLRPLVSGHRLFLLQQAMENLETV